MVWIWLLSVKVKAALPLFRPKVKLPGLKLCLYLDLATDTTIISSLPLGKSNENLLFSSPKIKALNCP